MISPRYRLHLDDYFVVWNTVLRKQNSVRFIYMSKTVLHIENVNNFQNVTKPYPYFVLHSLLLLALINIFRRIIISYENLVTYST